MGILSLMKTVIFLMGPTACGKTDCAMRLSQKISADIISVDSAMIYRGMDIGTAKPTSVELTITPHRLINLCDPAQAYSAGQFCQDAVREIEDIIAHHRVPLLVGGTMLYFHKLLFGIAPLPVADAVIRDAIASEAKKIGWGALHEKLKSVDPIAAEKIKPQDPQRISRALEVFYLTKKPISQWHADKQQNFLSNYNTLLIALIPENRAWLHNRIATRFEKMLENGLIEEVRQLYQRQDITPLLPSIRIVGYRQVWEYLDGKVDFDTMKQKAIAATRQLAKRQMTWLRSFQNLIVLDPEDPMVFEKLCDAIGA